MTRHGRNLTRMRRKPARVRMTRQVRYLTRMKRKPKRVRMTRHVRYLTRMKRKPKRMRMTRQGRNQWNKREMLGSHGQHLKEYCPAGVDCETPRRSKNLR